MYIARAVSDMSRAFLPSYEQYLAGTETSTEAQLIPQTEPLHEGQVKNCAGGYGYKTYDMLQFQRFLFLGSEKGTYYQNEKNLTKANVECIHKLISEGNAKVMIAFMREVNLNNRVAKSGPMLYSLAACLKKGDQEVKELVEKHLGEFVRIPTQLFEFIEYTQAVSQIHSKTKGWSRLQRRIIRRWYEEKSTKDLLYAMTKYQNRNGWCHRDVFRLCHIVPPKDDVERQQLLEWSVKREISNTTQTDVLRYISAFTKLLASTDEEEAVKLIKEYNFVREHVPTTLLNSRKVWETLLDNMPMTALIRNLNKITRLGIFDDAKNKKMVTDRLTDEVQLNKARIHPLKILTAMMTYKKGHGDKGKTTWVPNQSILDALDEAYDKSFKYVEPTNKKYLIGLDVSGSMSWGNCVGTPTLTPREGSAALAVTLMKSEPNVIVKGFSDEFIDVPLSIKRRLDDNIKSISDLPFGGTDLSLPITFADRNNLDVDCFIVLSDNETHSGDKHPTSTLRAYRNKLKKSVKYVNIQMTATNFSCMDPNDLDVLEISGFDAGMLEVINEFMSW